jgi:hypothetical protein
MPNRVRSEAVILFESDDVAGEIVTADLVDRLVIFEELGKNLRARIRICDMCSAYSVPLSRHLSFTPVLAKHSMAFSLVNAISVGVDRLQRNLEPMRKQSGASAARDHSRRNEAR